MSYEISGFQPNSGGGYARPTHHPTDVAVRDPRQHRVEAKQSLNCRLFIEAKYSCMLRLQQKLFSMGPKNYSRSMSRLAHFFRSIAYRGQSQRSCRVLQV